MAKSYNTHSYAGEQMLDPIIKPHIQDVALQDFGITVETTADSAYEWTLATEGDGYVRGYKKGFQGGAGLNLKDKRFALGEFKKETSYDWQKYRQRIQRLAFRQGVAMNNDTTGTTIAALEIAMHARGVRMGVYRSFWLGDTTKTIDVSGTAVADERYNTADGVWKEIMTRQSADNIPRLVLSGTGVSTALIDNGELQMDAAREIMKQVYVNASDNLKDLYDQGAASYYVVTPMIENYMETLESDGTTSAHTKLIEGVGSRLTFRGFDIYDMKISTTIRTDFDNASPFRVILTPPENLAVVIGHGSMAESRFWFNADENENRQRTQFEMEHGFIDPDLLSVAY